MRGIWFAIALLPVALFAQTDTKPYVGSQKCQPCHAKVYERWKKTLMANILQDAKANPAAILGDFSSAQPLVTVTVQGPTAGWTSEMGPLGASDGRRSRWPDIEAGCAYAGSRFG